MADRQRQRHHPADVKVGSKVTVSYTMTADSITAKPAKSK